MNTIICKQLAKYKDKNGKIIGYRLVDSQGNQKDIRQNDLKNAISNGTVKVTNLSLTKNGRLIEIDERRNNVNVEVVEKMNAKTKEKLYNLLEDKSNLFVVVTGPRENEIVTITHDYKKALEEKNDLAEDLNLYDPDPEYEGEFEVYIKIYDKDLNLIRDTDNEYYWVRLGKHPDILAKVTYKDLASFLYDENTVYCSKKTDEDYIFIDTDCGKDKDEIIDYARKMAKQYLCSEGGREYIKPFIRYEYGDNDDDGPIIDRKLASLDKGEQ